MQEREWRTLIQSVNTDFAGIVQAQRTLGEVNHELEQRGTNPVEEDSIFADWGNDLAGPKIIQIDGVSIQTRMLHRRGLSQRDIKGADLLYEIVGTKFVLIQYKRPNRQERVKCDKEQLNDLMGSCPNPCPPWETGFVHRCGSWYAIRPDDPTESSYVPACVAAQVFGKANSRKKAVFGFGLPRNDFQRVFGLCLIGARITPERLDRERIEQILIGRDSVVFEALQFGSFEAGSR